MSAAWHQTRTPEERVFQTYWRDGSLDLFVGLGALAVGLAWLFGVIWLGAVVPAMLVPLWSVFRQRLIEPRLGQARFNAERRVRVRRGHLGLLALGVVAFVVVGTAFFMMARGGPPADWVGRLIPALPAALLGIGALVAAGLFGLPRLAIYGIVFFIAGGAVAVTDGEPGWGILAGGLVTATSGAVLLCCFLRAFPRLQSNPD